MDLSTWAFGYSVQFRVIRIQGFMIHIGTEEVSVSVSVGSG